MKNKKVATIADLQSIASYENGEPLVEVSLLCDYRRKDSGINKVLVRKTVAEKLQNVQSQLAPHGLQLMIVEGYRKPHYQERYYLKQLLEEYQKDPSLDFDILIERAARCVALPSVGGHPTGGAVDVTIAREGKELPMGCGIADFSDVEAIPTFSPKATAQEAKNRLLLLGAMVEEGFAPFYGEWWHFSYGDREWAFFYGHAHTLYAPINPI